MNHTRPWRFDSNDDGWYDIYVYGDDWDMRVFEGGIHGPDGLACARLAAAAPDLLEALKAAVAEFDNPEIKGALMMAAMHGYSGTDAGRREHQALRDKIAAAIARAEGQ